MDGHQEQTTVVPTGAACPLCGEHDAEWLLQHDEHTVECQMCGVQFVTSA
jgi:Zn ribbon nucleic-acid-binding protein